MTSIEFFGELQLSQGGLRLSVPNALVNGLFQAIREPGVELPKDGEAAFSAHIRVMSAAEVDVVGAGKITERGMQYPYRLISAGTTESTRRLDEYGRYWVLWVAAPSLAAIRRSYGLGDPGVPFHIAFAARRKSVLRTGSVTKRAMTAIAADHIKRSIAWVGKRTAD